MASERAGGGARSSPFLLAGGKGAPIEIAASLALFLLFAYLVRGFVIDDTFITFRYAENLAHGVGLVYNAATPRPVEGYTSFTWVLLSALAIPLRIDPLFAARAVALLSGLGAILLLFRLSRRLVGDSAAALLPPWMLAASIGFALWSAGALETTFFSALLLLSLLLFFREERSARFPWSSISFGLLALTRPEGAAFFALSFGYRVLLALRSGRPVGKRLRFLACTLLLFVLFFLPHFLWRLRTYGLPFPHSYYAKNLPGGGVSYIVHYLFHLGPVALLACAALFLAARFRRETHRWGWIYLFASFVAVDFAGLWNINPVMAWEWRLLLHLSPLLFLMAAASLAMLARTRRRTARIGAGALALLLALSPFEPFLHGNPIAEARAHGRRLEKVQIGLGRWMRKWLPPETLLAVVDTGAIPYFSGLRAIDIANVPLHNPRMLGDDPKEIAREIEASEPEVLIVAGTAEWKVRFHPVRVELCAWAKERGYRGVFNLKFDEDYHLLVYMDPALLAGVDERGGFRGLRRSE